MKTISGLAAALLLSAGRSVTAQEGGRPFENALAERLARDPGLVDDIVEVDLSGPRLILRGLVDTEPEKRRAEALARALAGPLVEVDNRIRAQSGADPRATPRR